MLSFLIFNQGNHLFAFPNYNLHDHFYHHATVQINCDFKLLTKILLFLLKIKRNEPMRGRDSCDDLVVVTKCGFCKADSSSKKKKNIIEQKIVVTRLLWRSLLFILPTFNDTLQILAVFANNFYRKQMYTVDFGWIQIWSRC